jgi:large subunit ribosomal protein L9
MATKVVLLERVESLGQMGDVVAVKPGYARNYLLPQKKALRASKENIAYFEAQKKHLQAESDKRKTAAEKLAKKLEGLKVPLIRQASEGGQLFGSVTARDIANEVTTASKETVTRQQVIVNQNFKLIGLFPVEIMLHPEVKVAVTINIARSAEEAATQAKTGKALIADDGKQSQAKADEETALEGVLEEGALEQTKERKASEGAEEAAEAAESAEKSKARAAKKKAKPKKSEEAAEEQAESED